mmetsp:Transcript_5373/g.15377  ORF Transcript_5373/g.15377 Transcript_5373/m.15377 type:complete len:335 (+) Transcript_5373:346-1350(+)
MARGCKMQLLAGVLLGVLSLAAAQTSAGPTALASASAKDHPFWGELLRFINHVEKQPPLSPSSPFGKKLTEAQNKLKAEQNSTARVTLATDVTKTSGYTFPITPWSVPVSVNAKESAPPGVQKGKIAVGYQKRPNRNGYYYLPAGFNQRAMPIMVFLHGSGNTGVQMVTWFEKLADKYKFMILAPESSWAEEWQMASASQPFTMDWNHVEACYQWVTHIPGVRVDNSKVAYAGFSRGGYSAAALATRVPRATHALEFHSAISNAMLGGQTPWIWMSTGRQDPIFPVGRLQRVVQAVRGYKPRFWGKITIAGFSGKHGLNNPAELEAGIRWWFSK